MQTISHLSEADLEIIDLEEACREEVKRASDLKIKRDLMVLMCIIETSMINNTEETEVGPP